jgi:Protein of unknown function (DUF2735)
MVHALKRGAMSKEVEKNMTESLQRQSAKILQFPAAGRSALGGRRDDAKPAEPFTAPRVARIASGAWYHEEAIQEARRGCKL